MTVRELLQKIISESPNRLESEVYFDVPKDDYSVDSYTLDNITNYGDNDSLFFVLKENI